MFLTFFIFFLLFNMQNLTAEVSAAYKGTFGAELTWKLLGFTAEYNLTIPTSGSQFNGVSIGVSAKFGPEGKPAVEKEIKEE